MDPSTLRWILIVVGVVVLGAVLLFGNPNKKPKSRKIKKRKPNRRKPAAESRREPILDEAAEPSRFEDPGFSGEPRREPSLGPEGSGSDSGGDSDGDSGTLDQPELPMEDEPVAASSGESAAEPGQAPSRKPPGGPPLPEPDKVVVLYLVTRDNRTIAGVELLDAAIKSGMEFGEMNIFHRRIEAGGAPVFSMADLENPGHFDPEAWNTFQGRGMTLFMGLPGPMPALDALDALVASARRMADLLHLDVLDQQRQPFTRQREGEEREALRNFERQQQPEA